MSFYLYQLSYSKEAIKSMVANPSDREAAARKLIEAIGGKLHHLFFAFGQYDVICLIEAPDDKAMMAGAAAVLGLRPERARDAQGVGALVGIDIACGRLACSRECARSTGG